MIPKLLSLKVFNLIGYATTADSPLKAKAQKFLADQDIIDYEQRPFN